MKTIKLGLLAVVLGTAIASAGLGALRVRNQALHLDDLRKAAQLAEADGRTQVPGRDSALRPVPTAPIVAPAGAATPESGSTADHPGPSGPLASRWLERARALRETIARYPERQIPELALLTDEEFLLAAQTLVLDTEDDARAALSSLRSTAKAKVPELLQAAFRDYAAANADALPTEIAELTPYLKPPLTAAMLQRYDMIASGPLSEVGDGYLAAERFPVDGIFDTRYLVAANGWGRVTTTWSTYLTAKAIAAFAAANGNRKPTAASELQPYLEFSLEPADLQATFSAWQSNPGTMGLPLAAATRKAPAPLRP